MSSSRLDMRGQSSASPEFLVSASMLDVASASGDRGGMMLGAGMQGEPLTVSVLRPAPTRMVVVGGLYLARQIALRALATGAWIIIATGRPQVWQPVVRAAGNGPEGRPSSLVQLRRLSPADIPRPTEDMPLLVVHDGGHVPQELFPPRTAWQTTMYVLPYLHPQASSIANNADLVLLQRLPHGQAQLAGQLWRLPPQFAQQLTTLKDDHVIALGKDLWAQLRLITTSAEQQILGAIRRGD